MNTTERRNFMGMLGAAATTALAGSATASARLSGAELGKRNIATLKQWLECRDLTRHRDRLKLYTPDFIGGNPSAAGTEPASHTRRAVEQMAQTNVDHPEKETFPQWRFYNARIYAAMDNPNMYSINCLGEGRVVTPDHPEGLRYQNHYTHYFLMQNGLIKAWWETTIDTPTGGSRPPWEDDGRQHPPMIPFCQGY